MKVAVTWQMCGYADIEAETMEEAMEYFDRKCDDIPLPENAEYVDGSFELSSRDVTEMSVMAGLYDKAVCKNCTYFYPEPGICMYGEPDVPEDEPKCCRRR